MSARNGISRAVGDEGEAQSSEVLDQGQRGGGGKTRREIAIATSTASDLPAAIDDAEDDKVGTETNRAERMSGLRFLLTLLLLYKQLRNTRVGDCT